MLRFLDKLRGWERVASILEDQLSGLCSVSLSAIQWGEIAGKVRKDSGPAGQSRALQILTELLVTTVPITAEQAVRAAELKVDLKLSYADAFALELAMRTPGGILVTADYDFKAADHLARIEYLPSV